MVNSRSIRMVISIIVSKVLILWQLDVKNIFLQGELAELVFMKQPLGFADKKMSRHVN